MPEGTLTTPAFTSAVSVPRFSWTGRLEFDLINGPFGINGKYSANGDDLRVATIEMVIRIDDVSLWCRNRTVAVMDRDHFGEWLLDPAAGAFEVDDVVWSVQGPHLCIAIGGSTSYPVPIDTVQQLLAVI